MTEAHSKSGHNSSNSNQNTPGNIKAHQRNTGEAMSITRLFDDLAGPEGVLRPEALSDRVILDLVERKRRDDEMLANVPLEVNADRCVIEHNRRILMQCFIRFRRVQARVKLRAYIPVLNPGVHPLNSTATGDWVPAATHPREGGLHAEHRLASALDTAAQLHAAALIALGRDREEVRAMGHQLWDDAIDSIPTVMGPSANDAAA